MLNKMLLLSVEKVAPATRHHMQHGMGVGTCAAHHATSTGTFKSRSVWRIACRTHCGIHASDQSPRSNISGAIGLSPACDTRHELKQAGKCCCLIGDDMINGDYRMKPHRRSVCWVSSSAPSAGSGSTPTLHPDLSLLQFCDVAPGWLCYEPKLTTDCAAAVRATDYRMASVSNLLQGAITFGKIASVYAYLQGDSKMSGILLILLEASPDDPSLHYTSE